MKTSNSSFKGRQLLLAATGTAMIAVSQLASAGGPLNLNFQDPGNIERYPAGGVNIGYNPDQGACGALADPQDRIDDAFDAWENIPTASATYSNNGSLPTDINGTNFAPLLQSVIFGGSGIADGLSPVILDDDGSIFAALGFPAGVLGVATPAVFNADGSIAESETILGCATTVGAGGFPTEDFFGVMVHEFGHYSGMAHTQVNGSQVVDGDTTGPTPDNATFPPVPLAGLIETMYPFALIGGGEDTPHPDDIAYYSTAYPAPNFASTTGTISGIVFDGNGTTPLTGVNVIARNVADPFADAVSSVSGDRGIPGEYTIAGLTPGATYLVFIDAIGSGGFSTPGIPVPVEEFYNGANEGASGDDPLEATPLVAVAGAPLTGINFVLNVPQPGDPIALGDDNFVQIPLPFPFEICGQDFESVFINSNGNLTFGAGDPDFSPTAGEFLDGPPRVAGLWSDLSPNNGGTVFFEQTNDKFTVFFEDVPSFPATGATTFHMSLFRGSSSVTFGSRVKVEYGDATQTTGIAGVSCGQFATSGLEESSDLSANRRGEVRMNRSTATFEVFDFFSANDLPNSTLKYSPTRDFRDSFESNNSPFTATPISLPFASLDNIREFTEISPAGGDVDWFSFEGEAGASISAAVTRGNIDSVIVLTDANFNILALNDDNGTGPNGVLSSVSATLPADGTYFIAVSTFPDFGFTGDGNTDPFFGVGRYVLEVVEANCPTTGFDLIDAFGAPTNDGSLELGAGGFTFPFNGETFSTIFVNANGNLTFGAGDGDFSPSLGEFLSGPPRISVFWDDFEPLSGGTILANSDFASFLTLTYFQVPTFFDAFFGTGDSSTFCVTLTSDGSVTINADNFSLFAGEQFGIANTGVTEGNGAADPGPTDLSTDGPFPAEGTTYEEFLFNTDIDLVGNTVTFLPGEGEEEEANETPPPRRGR